MPATQPGAGRGKKKDHGFRVSADGRLIIREEEEDAATAKMEEEEGTKGEDACPLWECNGTRSFIRSLICSFTHSFRPFVVGAKVVTACI